ncbi:hypothetical protein LO772_14690 [Yinghuangia sp. ASG 101]|uniref:hypothetical protein n=1 Tax=Yinghuangia sp. ASG 101 TaxID=2896848 RepID=UPI001E508048|nr:hypothetical protein [Yinghuangia sp. ASG 101]UGQ14713.1 hypothetical protein LO772_14690 [Yinghuangia sp. ASG 101]
MHRRSGGEDAAPAASVRTRSASASASARSRSVSVRGARTRPGENGVGEAEVVQERDQVVGVPRPRGGGRVPADRTAVAAQIGQIGQIGQDDRPPVREQLGRRDHALAVGTAGVQGSERRARSDDGGVQGQSSSAR